MRRGSRDVRVDTLGHIVEALPRRPLGEQSRPARPGARPPNLARLGIGLAHASSRAAPPRSQNLVPPPGGPVGAQRLRRRDRRRARHAVRATTRDHGGCPMPRSRSAFFPDDAAGLPEALTERADSRGGSPRILGNRHANRHWAIMRTCPPSPSGPAPPICSTLRRFGLPDRGARGAFRPRAAIRVCRARAGAVRRLQRRPRHRAPLPGLPRDGLRCAPATRKDYAPPPCRRTTLLAC